MKTNAEPGKTLGSAPAPRASRAPRAAVPGAAVRAAVLFGALAALSLVFGPTGATASEDGYEERDGLEELAVAVDRFRGLGHDDVSSYRVRLELPDDPEAESIPLQEVWRAPSDLALRGADASTPRAIIRGLAIYLEPMYVARASLLAADLASSVARIRESCTLEGGVADGVRTVSVGFPVSPDPELPAELNDLARLVARLDSGARLLGLELEMRDGQSIVLTCEYGRADAPQPTRAVWLLPNDERVDITTTYSAESGRVLPASRHLVFPSPYDPGEREEILVNYADWELGAALEDSVFTEPGAFRYDGNGLVTD